MLSSPGAEDRWAITAVDPRSERGEVGADRLQDSGAMHCVEGIGNVH